MGVETKLSCVVFFVVLCVVGGVILSIVQVSNDFTQLGVFYKGFMGRKLFIKEHLLVTRDKAEVRSNDGVYDNNILQVLASLVEPCYDRQERIPAMLFTLPGQVDPDYGWGDQVAVTHPPSSLKIIEEEEPEWRELDYDLEVGHPPDTFCQFYLQQGCGVYSNAHNNNQVGFEVSVSVKHNDYLEQKV